VFATRIAQDISSMTPQTARPLPVEPPFHAEQTPEVASPHAQELRSLMSRYVGVIRDAKGLARALESISLIEREATAPALRNMATAALLIAAAAFVRRESRGAHTRSDYPRTDPAQARRTFLTLTDARRIAADATTPIHAD
jgi:L-aspartate oxidase